MVPPFLRCFLHYTVDSKSNQEQIFERCVVKKFVPYEKLSKKEKKKRDSSQRNTWGDLNPVTRKPENSRAYNRRKAQAWKNNLQES